MSIEWKIYKSFWATQQPKILANFLQFVDEYFQENAPIILVKHRFFFSLSFKPREFMFI